MPRRAIGFWGISKRPSGGWINSTKNLRRRASCCAAGPSAIRVALAERHVSDALAIVEKGRMIDGQLSADLDFATLEV